MIVKLDREFNSGKRCFDVRLWPMLNGKERFRINLRQLPNYRMYVMTMISPSCNLTPFFAGVFALFTSFFLCKKLLELLPHCRLGQAIPLFTFTNARIISTFFFKELINNSFRFCINCILVSEVFLKHLLRVRKNEPREAVKTRREATRTRKISG